MILKYRPVSQIITEISLRSRKGFALIKL